MTEPKDWYTAGKLLWTILHARKDLPERILIHPADGYRIRQRLSADMLNWDGRSVFGVPVEVQHERPEHVADLVYRGWEWVPVVFDPIDFEEPVPVKQYQDGNQLARWVHRPRP